MLRRRSQALVLFGHLPGFEWGRVGQRRQRPEFDPSGLEHAVGVVGQPLPRLDHAIPGRRLREHRVHQRQHRGGGAERDVEAGVAPRLAGTLDPRAQQGAGAVELLRIRALEGVDRLLAVAHREHRAHRVRGARAGEELRGQRMRDLPLRGGGVLHLVQQQVVEPAIQLVQHPGGARIDQQVGGASDQVVVVDQPGRLLVPRIGLQHRGGERHQRRRDRRELQRAAAVVRLLDARGLGLESGQQVGVGLVQLGVDEGGVAPHHPRLGEEARPPRIPMRRAILRRKAQPAEDLGRPLRHLGRALRLDAPRRLAQVGLRLPVHRRSDDFGPARRVNPERSALRGFERGAEGERAGQPLPVRLQRRDVPAELIRRGESRQPFQRRPQCGRVGGGEHVLPRLGQRILGIAVVHELEMRRQRRLEREAAEQGLAEGVDRADAHAARQVEHRREQRAGAHSSVVGGFHLQAAEFLVERRVRQRHPAPEGPLQPQRHLRGGGLGEGQALDALRLRAREHQPQQPVGQQLRLPRPGRGRHEGRDAGIRRIQLCPIRPHPRRRLSLPPRGGGPGWGGVRGVSDGDRVGRRSGGGGCILRHPTGRGRRTAPAPHPPPARGGGALPGGGHASSPAADHSATRASCA